MINYDKVAEKIFAIIKGHGHTLTMFTDDGMETSDPEAGRRFFVKKPNYMITLDDENNVIKINKNSNVGLDDIEGIMKQAKNLARQHMLKTELKVFGKEIAPKDFAYQAQKYKDKKMSGLGEASISKLHGSKKTSYQTLESVKVIVRHRKPVDEEVQGSRGRQIHSIFLEQNGERFRFPHNYLPGARAMARHMYEGGSMQDSIGEYIVESIGNLLQLNEFVRYARVNKLINEESEDVVKTVRENITTIRNEIKGLTGAKTYFKTKDTIEERDGNVIEEDDTTDIKDMFTVRKFDEKFSETLPLVKRLINEKTAWRKRIEEASLKTVELSKKEELAEDDIMEFDSPIQKMGYKIRRIAERMIEEGSLQKFVGRVAGKLIEGNELSKFEQNIIRNVMENAVIKEEDCEVCDDCDCEECICEKKDVVEQLAESFELNMKMLEADWDDEDVNEDPDDWDHGYNYEGSENDWDDDNYYAGPNAAKHRRDAETRRGEHASGATGMGYPENDFDDDNQAGVEEKNYYVTYRNQGRPEKTSPDTLEQAKRSADFLKYQGANGVKVRKV